jgi:CheY-like chemotaxis protein
MLVVREPSDRDIVLVIAGKPMRDMLAELVRASGFEVRAATTPLETIQILERQNDHLRCAIVSSHVSWAPAVWELLADEYPGIERIALDD